MATKQEQLYQDRAPCPACGHPLGGDHHVDMMLESMTWRCTRMQYIGEGIARKPIGLINPLNPRTVHGITFGASRRPHANS